MIMNFSAMSLTIEAWEYNAILAGHKTQHRVFTPWEFKALSYNANDDTLTMLYPSNGGRPFCRTFTSIDDLCDYAANFCPYRNGEKVALFVKGTQEEPVGYFYANVTTRYSQEIPICDAVAEGLSLKTIAGKKQWVIPDYITDDDNSSDLVRFFTDDHTLALNKLWDTRTGYQTNLCPIKHELLFYKGTIFNCQRVGKWRLADID